MVLPPECALLCSTNQGITPDAQHHDLACYHLTAFALAVPLASNAFPQTFAKQAPFTPPVVT